MTASASTLRDPRVWRTVLLRLRTLVGVIGLMVFAAAIIHAAPLALTVVGTNVWLIPIGLALTGGFVLLKALALKCAAHSVGMSVSLAQSARIFSEGVTVELVTWPGKLVADGYRVTRLGDGPIAARIAAIAACRLGAMCSGVVALLAASAVFARDSTSLLWSALALGVVIVLCMGLIRGWLKARSASHRLPSLGGMGLACVAATACDVAMFSLIVAAITGVPFSAVALRYVLLGALASGSTVPLGLGVLEAACSVALHSDFAIEPSRTLAALAVYRLLGPFITLVGGAISILSAPMAAAPSMNGQRLHL